MDDFLLSRMRPTLIVGTGGTGQQILTQLKAIFIQRHGETGWRSRIRLIAFDTAEETVAVETTTGRVRLEPGSEFINIGSVPVPNIKKNIDGLDVIRDRMGPIMAELPPVVLRSGAKQLRPFGLLSVLWNYRTVLDELQQAIWHLAGRDRQENNLNRQQGINVLICGSLAGGTGSGTFLDLAYLIRSLFEELGTQAEFCHLTGVGVLPQAFHGISGPNLYPNTAAALKELNYLTIKNGFNTRYPDGRLIDSHEAPFNLFYVLDGVDERGQTWPGITEVCRMAAEGLYLQIGSQLGRKGENAFDNLDEVLTGQTADGYGTFLASFGLAHLEFDAQGVAELCAKMLLRDLLQACWLKSPDSSVVPDQVEFLLGSLNSSSLEKKLLYDPQLEIDIGIDLVLPEWLMGKSIDEIAAEAGQYVREYGHARLTETFIPCVQQNAGMILSHQEKLLAEWIQSNVLNPEMGIGQTQQVLAGISTQLGSFLTAGRKTAAELNQQIGRQQETVTHLETALSRVAATFFIGRSGRMQRALIQYFQSAAELFVLQLQQQVVQAQLHIWGALLAWSTGEQENIRQFQQRLQRLADILNETIPAQSQALAAGDIARISLADVEFVQELYGQYRFEYSDCIARLGPPSALQKLPSDSLLDHLIESLRPTFDTVASLTVKDVILAKEQEMSIRARRQQLFQMATPSWNVDRSRLPDGGAGLVRLEVLGVTDSNNSLFEGEPMLVTTHDPHRLTALVVAAGAPQTALQQYDLYCRLLEKSGSRRPVHVIPQFLASADQARLAFALGSIFEFVFNQGTFFYYRPADPLQPSVKLANGLNNAIEALSAHDGLTVEVMERVEKRIAQLGLRETIDILTNYYSVIPSGVTSLDNQLRELKQLVRNYTDDLRRIDEFHSGVPVSNGR